MADSREQIGANLQSQASRGDDRRSRIVDQHHVYYDPKNGQWGLRGNLVVLALWDDEFASFVALSPEERLEQYGDNSRYFGARKGYTDGVK